MPPPPPIDAVFTYVNGEDPAWADRYTRVTGKRIEPARCHDHGELRYAVALLVLNAPWVRNIYVVHAGDDDAHIVPETYDAVAAAVAGTRHRLTWVPQRNVVPCDTFNSCEVESHLWRLPGLSATFLYCNDDMFFARPVPVTAYWRENRRAPAWWAHLSLRPHGTPVANVAQAHCANARALVPRLLHGTPTPTMAALQRQWGLAPFDAPHFPAVLTLSACRHVWANVGDVLRARQPQVRSRAAVNFQVLATAAMVALGEAVPLSRTAAERKLGLCTALVEDESSGLRHVRERRPHFCCINGVSAATSDAYHACMNAVLQASRPGMPPPPPVLDRARRYDLTQVGRDVGGDDRAGWD